MEKYTLKQARQLREITQEEMAKMLGVSTSTYQSYETYNTFMRMDSAYKFAHYVDMSVDQLIFLPNDYILNVV